VSEAVLTTVPESVERAGAIHLDNVTKRFDSVTAVDNIDIEIAAGEFFSLLGPSGCGKTTTLRLIAGFELPTSGRILVGNEDVTQRRPAKRPLNMVFQDYALFPHLTVGDNIAFGLKLKKLGKAETSARLTEAIQTMRLEGLVERRPSQLSGGQRQRVALARALVNRPRALLLDEPLGALDLQLRKQMQAELRRVHRQTGTTFVYVTHDQEEALTMSDRIAVIQDGKVRQLADPRTMYERPSSDFVAEFIGTSNVLVLAGSVGAGEILTSNLGDGERLTARLPTDLATTDVATTDGRTSTQVTVRPERISLHREAPSLVAIDASLVRGTVADVVYLGSLTQVSVALKSGESLVIRRMSDEPNISSLRPGDAVVATWPLEGSHVIGPALS
jgi:spermidine/putrescine transport system ATP-binding protein